MFTKVLVSDDLTSINQGVLTILDTMGIKNVRQVQYCDDAYLQIKKASLDGQPYQLVITDLSFKVDHREQQFASGEVLIKALKMAHPELKVIAYSVDDRLQKVRHVIQDCHADGYVCKGRRGLIELAAAIEDVYKDNIYVSPQVAQALDTKLNLDIDDIDIAILTLLSQGLTQEDISQQFKQQSITPSSLSAIEKRLIKLRIQFQANNAIHLVAIVKDLGLI
uniref:response regulator n=1 Tax=Gelidibacter sp. TaxID=2018083 RepID=UPI00404AE62C